MLLAALILASVASEDMLLLEKAERFREALLERHLAPEGLVLYRVNLDTLKNDLERGAYPDLADTPTFTGLYAATACTRARVENRTRAQEARTDADRALSGLELLMNVTGRRGLLARAVRRDTPSDEIERPGRWQEGGPGFRAYRWRGDVSVDQYANGLLPAVAECRDLFPGRARRLIVDFAAHLLEHDLEIVDGDGKRTRFGDLSPSSGLGFNSLAQLTAFGTFALAAALDPNPEWVAMRDRLRDRERVVSRARTTNLRVLGVTNRSNDLMAWNLYRVLIPLVGESCTEQFRNPRGACAALADLRHGMLRTWLRVRSDRNPYFALVLCFVEPGSCPRDALVRARDTLRRFPTDKRKREIHPDLRKVPRALLPGRKWRPRARHRVPIEIRPPSSLEWKSSPYRVTGGVAPRIEYTGVDYLAAYWLYRVVIGQQRSLGGR